jgi:hypothetical protein
MSARLHARSGPADRFDEVVPHLGKVAAPIPSARAVGLGAGGVLLQFHVQDIQKAGDVACGVRRRSQRRSVRVRSSWRSPSRAVVGSRVEHMRAWTAYTCKADATGICCIPADSERFVGNWGDRADMWMRK